MDLSVSDSLVSGLVLLVAGLLLAAYWWIHHGRCQSLGPRSDTEITSFTSLETQIAEFEGWSIRYHLSGDRSDPVMVLVHGIGANLFCWRALMKILGHKASVLALDLPGFGGSSKNPQARYGLDDQAERLVRFLDHLGIQKCYMVGNSMGANISLAVGLKYPERVLGVVAIAPATSPRLVPALWLTAPPWMWLASPASKILHRRYLRAMHSRSVFRQDLIEDGRIEESFRTYGGNSAAVRTLLLATAAIRDQRLPSLFKDLKCRVLILWGSHDSLVGKKDIAALEAVLPAHESHVHLGAGHHLQEDEPEWVADKILSFFPITKS